MSSPLHWQDTPQASSHSPVSNPPVVSVSNPWFAVAMGLLGLIVGYLLATAGGSTTTSGNAAPSPTVVPQVAPTAAPQAAAPAGDVPAIDAKVDHIRGNPDADVAVIEYSDFECPFCARVHPTLKQVIDTYGDKVMWVYRHYPLGFHPNAEPAAIASECVNELEGNEAFWDFVDKIFAAQGDWAFEKHVADLRLDVEEFKACMSSNKWKQHVADDMAGGSAAGVSGTPGNIVINLKTKEAREVSGAQPFASFQAAIDAMLASK